MATHGRTHYLLLVILSAMALANVMQGQQKCTNKTNAGRYVVVCDGFMTIPNGPMVPAKALGTASSRGDGNFVGDATVSSGGMILQQHVTGTQQLNPDCTGTISYTQWINGQPAPPLDITFVISDNGDTVNGLSIDQGTVFSCVLRRMSRPLLLNEK